MKKLLSILLVIVLCASMMNLTAFAAQSGSMSVTSAEVAAGSSTTITVSLTSNPGVMAYTVKPSVPEGFTIQMAKAGMDGIWTIGKNAQWDNGEDSTYTGPILTVTVTADASVAPGTYSISFSAAGANYDEEDVSFGTCTATITVPKPVCNHVWNDGEVTQAATCTEDGVMTYTCELCPETKTDVIEATGHSFGEWTQTKAPTCTEKGEETRECTVCPEKETREVNAAGHSFGEWTQTKAPTCTEKGEETREIDPNGHALNSYGKDATHHWLLCDNCDHTGEKEAHSYDYNGVCVCGATKTTTEDPDLDDVPKTGDVTPYIIMSFGFVFILTVAFVLKRKTAK